VGQCLWAAAHRERWAAEKIRHMRQDLPLGEWFELCEFILDAATSTKCKPIPCAGLVYPRIMSTDLDDLICKM
jgi:hypothetical protein